MFLYQREISIIYFQGTLKQKFENCFIKKMTVAYVGLITGTL